MSCFNDPRAQLKTTNHITYVTWYIYSFVIFLFDLTEKVTFGSRRGKRPSLSLHVLPTINIRLSPSFLRRRHFRTPPSESCVDQVTVLVDEGSRGGRGGARKMTELDDCGRTMLRSVDVTGAGSPLNWDGGGGGRTNCGPGPPTQGGGGTFTVVGPAFVGPAFELAGTFTTTAPGLLAMVSTAWWSVAKPGCDVDDVTLTVVTTGSGLDSPL